jgi:hypothetical protein
MIVGFFTDSGNIAFLALFGLLGLALRKIAREQPEPEPERELLPEALVPAARIEAVLAPFVERRVASRPVKFERRGLRAPRAAAVEAAVGAGLVGAGLEETALDETALDEGVVARLVPQIPMRAGETARSWFGGAPEMPAVMPWPKFSGRRGLFLAQICCADLPEQLWSGRGPRKGWLAFFIDPQDGRDLRALHFAERAAPRPAPAPGACCTWRQGGEGPRRIDAFPRWPLDIVAVTAADGAADPRAPAPPEAAPQASVRAGFDLASPERHPADWASFFALTDMALAAMARRRILIRSALPDVQKQLANARKQIELGGMAAAMLHEMQRKAGDLPPLVEGWTQAVASLDAAMGQVQTLADELRGRAEAASLSGEDAAALMERLAEIELVHVERVPEPERGAGAERARITRLPLTRHDPDARLFVDDYESLREDWAKHAWCAGADALPDAQRGYFEARWRELAAHEMSGMGHAPFRDIRGFDRERQSVLIEFVSSELLKWRFGDGGSLAATIDNAALAQGDFTRLRTQTSG